MERKTWIDVLRGMAMLLVVLGHCIGFTDNPVNRMILCFHMVLFYFISGLTFSPSRYVTLRNGIKAKFLGIGLQYICFSMMGIALYYALAFMGLQENGHTVSLFKAFAGMFFPDGHIGMLVTMGFWFVYDIIVLDLICLTVYFSYKKQKWQLCVLPVIYIVCMSFANIDIVLRQSVGLLFFLLGQQTMNMMQSKIDFRKLSLGGGKCTLIFISVILLIVLYYSSFCNIPVYIYKFEIGDIFIFTINAVLGIVAFVMLALFVNSNRVFEWIGRNTLPILFSHFALQRSFYLIANILFPSMKKDYGEYVWSTTPFWVVTFVFLVLASSLFAYMINRYFPSLIGKGKLREKLVLNLHGKINCHNN